MSLRTPERLFAAGGWLLSLLFAAFLLGIGSSILRELPGIDRGLSVEQFVDRAAQAALEAEADQVRGRLAVEQQREAELERTRRSAEETYDSARELFDNWLAARATTARSDQDPEVLARTRGLDSLRTIEQAWRAKVEAQQQATSREASALEQIRQREEALTAAAMPQYERARMAMELKVFGIRLALTLPLLVAAGWMIRRRRQDRFWPLYRGFVLFAFVTFFVELVPYLPSYGNYVRNLVGILATIAGAKWLAGAMQRYQARRVAAQQQPEVEKRKQLDGEQALAMLGKGQCPGCARAVEGGLKAPQNFCGHCAMHLFHVCASCGQRQTTFLPFCIQCGASMDRDAGATGTPRVQLRGGRGDDVTGGAATPLHTGAGAV